MWVVLVGLDSGGIFDNLCLSWIGSRLGEFYFISSLFICCRGSYKWPYLSIELGPNTAWMGFKGTFESDLKLSRGEPFWAPLLEF